MDQHGLPLCLYAVERRARVLPGLGRLWVFLGGTPSVHRYRVDLRPGSGKSGLKAWVDLLIERSTAGEELRMLTFLTLLFILAVWGFLVVGIEERAEWYLQICYWRYTGVWQEGSRRDWERTQSNDCRSCSPGLDSIAIPSIAMTGTRLIYVVPVSRQSCCYSTILSGDVLWYPCNSLFWARYGNSDFNFLCDSAYWLAFVEMRAATSCTWIGIPYNYCVAVGNTLLCNRENLSLFSEILCYRDKVDTS